MLFIDKPNGSNTLECQSKFSSNPLLVEKVTYHSPKNSYLNLTSHRHDSLYNQTPCLQCSKLYRPLPFPSYSHSENCVCFVMSLSGLTRGRYCPPSGWHLHRWPPRCRLCCPGSPSPGAPPPPPHPGHGGGGSSLSSAAQTWQRSHHSRSLRSPWSAAGPGMRGRKKWACSVDWKLFLGVEEKQRYSTGVMSKYGPKKVFYKKLDFFLMCLSLQTWRYSFTLKSVVQF